jgi:hypothetical protein
MQNEKQAQVVTALAADPDLLGKFRADLAWLISQYADARGEARAAKDDIRDLRDEVRAVRDEIQAVADDPSVPTAARIRLERLAGRLLAIAS